MIGPSVEHIAVAYRWRIDGEYRFSECIQDGDERAKLIEAITEVNESAPLVPENLDSVDGGLTLDALVIVLPFTEDHK